jgi:hypothetical protein
MHHERDRSNHAVSAITQYSAAPCVVVGFSFFFSFFPFFNKRASGSGPVRR